MLNIGADNRSTPSRGSAEWRGGGSAHILGSPCVQWDVLDVLLPTRNTWGLPIRKSNSKLDQFVSELLREDSVECWTEVYEQHSDIWVFFVQMCEGWVEGSGDGVIGRAVGLICKLEGVRGGGADLMWCMTNRSKHFMRIGVSATGW